VKIVIDSYAWIELLSGTEKGKKVSDLIDASEVMYTPGIVLAEIARKLFKEGKEANIIKSQLDSIVSISKITAIDAAIAHESANCYLQLADNAKKFRLNTPGLFDAIILATCRLLQAKVITGDEHFKNFPETIWIK
jgi:predicted nucleic acid-binding protein